MSSNTLQILSRILEILNQKIAMGQGEGGRMRRVYKRKPLGGVLAGCDMEDCDESSEEYMGDGEGGVLAGKRMKKKGGVLAGKREVKKRTKRVQNPWLAHVKAYQKKHGVKYNVALKEAKATYKKCN